MEKKDLLILHGALGSASQFSELELQLSAEFHIHCFDLYEHGRRCSGRSFTIQDITDDVYHYIKEQLLVHCCIFGYSMGGYVALQLALQHPKLVSSIMTLGTKLDWTKETAEKESVMLNPATIKDKVPHYAASLQKMHDENWENLVVNTGKMMHHLALAPITSEELKTIKQPVRFSIGDKDNMVSLAETTAAFHAIENSSLLVIPGTKHPIEKVDQQRLAYEIRNFFNG